jgi:hypothetical protein
MAQTQSDPCEDFCRPDEDGVFRLPALIKGELVFAPRISRDRLRQAAAAATRPGAEEGAQNPGATADAAQSFRFEGAQVVSLPRPGSPAGERQFLLFPQVRPDALIETDQSALARELYALPFREVMDYVGALREELRRDGGARQAVTSYAKAASPLAGEAFDILFRTLPEMLDPPSLAEAVDRELGNAEAPGTRYLDGWVTVPARTHEGMTARLSAQLFGKGGARRAAAFRPRLRAMPTRQLHITAGNSALVPFLSIVRALATKSAAVIKSPAESTAPAVLLALAMRAVDPRHPITRHTSLVYWKGGDRRVEDALFAQGAFDRIVVWGSPETVRSVGARSGFTKTIFLNPRYGVSFIGREALSRGVGEAAVRAAADTLVANQMACISSLVHYVEGTESQALEYCRVLKEVLARWDRALPHTLSRPSLGKLRLLRRRDFLGGTWFENGRWPQTTSLVVYMPTEFDVSSHPMCRCVVVRSVESLNDALPFLHSGVSTLGVYPEARRRELRDEIAARGVSNIFPLGECERAYAGMPHDGMRVLSELVSWTNG